MSNNRKEVLINLRRKVGYLFLERENKRVQSSLRDRLSRMFYDSNLLRRHSERLEGSVVKNVL